MRKETKEPSEKTIEKWMMEKEAAKATQLYSKLNQFAIANNYYII